MTAVQPRERLDPLPHSCGADDDATSGEAAGLSVVSATGAVDGRRHASVWLEGVICAGTSDKLTAAVERLLRGGAQSMSFDLAGLRLCTSDGIELWVSLVDRLRRRGGSLALLNASGVVSRVLTVAGEPELVDLWSNGATLPRHPGERIGDGSSEPVRSRGAAGPAPV